MKLFYYIFALSICASIHASQGFYREGVIDPASALSVLDPARRPEIERLAQNLRFFGQLSSRPSQDVYVHYQAIQNLLIFPTSPTTALSWMLFPISPLPTINPNNIGISDPLGKITPEQLGQLIAVIAGYKNPTHTEDRTQQLQAIYQVLTPSGKVAGFTANHSEDSLKEFYRYAIIEGVNKYVHRNMTPIDEDLHLTTEQQAACVESPHLLVMAAFESSSSHLLEIPGTEIMREVNETWFTRGQLLTGLQELPMAVKDRVVYKKFSDQGRVKFRTQATVDMLWKSTNSNPDQTLQLLTHYAWRKFGDQIDTVLLASGAISEAQRPDLMRVLATPYTKADYRDLVAGVKASTDIDSFMDSLTESQRNLLLYGGSRYAQIRFQDYGNVTAVHEGRSLAFANCAEMSLFNLTYLAQLQEQEMGLERNRASFPEGSPLHMFWAPLEDDELGTTATRNTWTKAICRLNGIVYRKGGERRTPWEDTSTAHWAELNPGIINQIRTLFHLLGKPDEAAALTYIGSTEENIEAAARRLSQLLSGEPQAEAGAGSSATGSTLMAGEETAPQFAITPRELKNIVGKKDWYGEFEISRKGVPLAVWNIQNNHSYLQPISNNIGIFPVDKAYTNPYIIGQMEVTAYHFSQDVSTITPSEKFLERLDVLKINPEKFKEFFAHANLVNEHFRILLARFCKDSGNISFFPFAHQIMWKMVEINAEFELSFLANSTPSYSTDPKTQRLSSFCSVISGINPYDQACICYKGTANLSECNTLQPDNRCVGLYFDISVSTLKTCNDIPADKAIEILSRINLPKLKDIRASFDKDCLGEDVASIAQLLPKNLGVSIDKPILPEHFWAFFNNTKNTEIIWLSLSHWYSPDYMFKEQSTFLPPTQQEYVYELLLPFAKAGRPFETPFIELDSDEDLEPVYEALRFAATVHKPMPLMLEDAPYD